ncbi:hypothetical protein GCM10010435_39890 [Winogradskya consettensis]|uniref:WXG100 family type VII secretion target n=1 Tax=Winogradskya consettensis TaxID=113560 RepID=A0A919VN59_9ACTN|nr:hypothetical protein [Actinoplanes consettensis]GIM69595.1 hypothetical protein Aco04nite_16020 [Actinoplanes consettensis]
MSTNPLVAPSSDSTTWYTGLGLVEDAADITNGIRSNSWVDGSLGGVGASLDMLSLAVDPLGTLVSWGVSWLMEHVQPLKDALDWLAGNADEVAAHAATWSNVSAFTDQARQQYADRLGAEVSEWFGPSGDAYREHAAAQMHVLEGLATAAQGISYAVEGAGLLVALVRGIVRDLIAEFIGTLAARLPQWLAEEGLTLGLATPVVIGQVSTLVAKWVNKIQHFVRGLLNSLRRLHPMLDNLATVLTNLSGRNRALARTDPTEFKPGFPHGSDYFIDDGDPLSQRAIDAYRRARNSPEATSVVAANTGIDPRIIEGMRQNLFVQQHDVPISPGHVESGYFTPHERIADLWEGAVSGSLTPSQLDQFRNLAGHEYVENRLMAAGIPYRSTHPESFDPSGDPIINPNHPGAHDLAPNEWKPATPFAHWRAFGLDGSNLEMAGDLSNLDEVVDAALRGLGR